MELRIYLTRVDIVLARTALALRPSFVFWLNLALAISISAFVSSELRETGSLAVVIAALLVLIGFCFLTILGIFASALEVALGRKTMRGVLGSHLFRLTDEGFIEETEFNRTVNSWPSVDRVVRFAGLTLVRVAAGWHIIPRRDISSSPDGEAFMRALRDRVAQARALVERR